MTNSLTFDMDSFQGARSEIRYVEQRGEHVVMLRAQTLHDNQWNTYRLQFEPDSPNGIVSWSMNVEGTGHVSLRSKED